MGIREGDPGTCYNRSVACRRRVVLQLASDRSCGKRMVHSIKTGARRSIAAHDGTFFFGSHEDKWLSLCIDYILSATASAYVYQKHGKLLSTAVVLKRKSCTLVITCTRRSKFSTGTYSCSNIYVIVL